MPWELIYTSAPRGLVSGQSGFCTVARTADLRDALAQRLEQISSYHYLELTGMAVSKRNPTISAYRILDIRGTRFHVLTRILPCGLDFTARTNHLAHHLVFGADELAHLPSPAAILRHWDGWQSGWQREPRVLAPLLIQSFSRLPPISLPAKTWLRITGDAGRAAGLLESEFGRGCYLITPSGDEQLLLDLFCETLQLLNPGGKWPLRPWQHSFTTFLQSQDAVSDFHWRGCRDGTPVYKQLAEKTSLQGGYATLIALADIRIPNNPLAKLAREGPNLPPLAPAPAIPSARAPLTLRKSPTGNQFVPRRPAGTVSSGRPSVSHQKETGGWTISIRKKSLVALGIAVVLLAGLLGARHFLLRKPLTASDSPVNSKHPQTNVPQQNPDTRPKALANPAAPGIAANPPAAANITEARFDSEKASKELDSVLPNLPTYLVLVTNLEDEVTLTNILPLRDMLLRFHYIKVEREDRDARYKFNIWDISELVRLEVIPTDPPRLVYSNPEFQFTFKYKDLAKTQPGQENIGLQITSVGQLSDKRAVSIVFRPEGSNAFRLLVVNQSKPPPSRELDARLLVLFNAQKQEIEWSDLLTERLMQFRVSDSKWELKPYVRLKNTNATVSLYSQLKPEIGSNEDLEFGKIKGRLRKKYGEEQTGSESIQKRIDGLRRANPSPNTNLDFPVGGILGLTDTNLLSFSRFLRAKPESPKLFLRYLKGIAENGKKQRPWLQEWLAETNELPARKLQDFYTLCVTNLDPQSLSLLNLRSQTNYFVSVWQSLTDTEEIKKLQKEKDDWDKELSRLQACLELVPDSLDGVAYVSLFLNTRSNIPLEIIRFTPQRK